MLRNELRALQVNFYEMVSLSAAFHKTRPVNKEGSSLNKTDNTQTNQPTN